MKIEGKEEIYENLYLPGIVSMCYSSFNSLLIVCHRKSDTNDY